MVQYIVSIPWILMLYLCQRLNTATSSPADDVHHYVIPQKLLDSIFNKVLVLMRQWEKEKAVLYIKIPIIRSKAPAQLLSSTQNKVRVLTLYPFHFLKLYPPTNVALPVE
jgi:hypothetical protein